MVESSVTLVFRLANPPRVLDDLRAAQQRAEIYDRQTELAAGDGFNRRTFQAHDHRFHRLELGDRVWLAGWF
jgi:hypothetical protein